jgi:hypothetical protein
MEIPLMTRLGKNLVLAISVTAMLGWSIATFAHHSRSRYDMSEMVEIEGELTIFSWRNPHVHVQIKTLDESGNEVLWDMEGDSLSILRRTGAQPEGIEVGSRVKVAGFGTTRPSNDMLIFNLLSEDGREVLVNTRAKPRWSDEASGGQGVWMTGGTAEATRGDIFRVWSSSFGPQGSFGKFWPASYPLSDSARAVVANWDPSVDVVAKGCEPKGMPHIMEQPYPMEFVMDEENVLLRIEEYDTVRTIYMSSNSAPPDSILGHSIGHWEDETLVVSTDSVTYQFFDDNGTPQGSNASYIERFRVSDDNSRLEYEVTVEDDEIFTEPVTLTKHWIWRPGETVEPYECVE